MTDRLSGGARGLKAARGYAKLTSMTSRYDDWSDYALLKAFEAGDQAASDALNRRFGTLDEMRDSLADIVANGGNVIETPCVEDIGDDLPDA